MTSSATRRRFSLAALPTALAVLAAIVLVDAPAAQLTATQPVSASTATQLSTKSKALKVVKTHPARKTSTRTAVSVRRVGHLYRATARSTSTVRYGWTVKASVRRYATLTTVAAGVPRLSGHGEETVTISRRVTKSATRSAQLRVYRSSPSAARAAAKRLASSRAAKAAARTASARAYVAAKALAVRSADSRALPVAKARAKSDLWEVVRAWLRKHQTTPTPTTSTTPPVATTPTTPPTTSTPATSTTSPPPATTTAPPTTATPTAPAPTSTAAAGFPSSATTGVPQGTKLTAFKGILRLSTPNTVVSGYDVDGCVVVTASNVVFEKSRVRGGGAGCWDLISNQASGLTVRDVELDGGGNADLEGMSASNFTLQRADIHGVGDGVRANGNVVIEDSWIHDLASQAGSHNDGIQTTAGSNIVIRGNRIENQLTQTSAIMIGADTGNVSGVTVENNLLAGGGYTVYGGARPPSGRTIKAIVIRDNVFTERFFSNAGAYGPLVATADPQITVSGNRWLESATRTVQAKP